MTRTALFVVVVLLAAACGSQPPAVGVESYERGCWYDLWSGALVTCGPIPAGVGGHPQLAAVLLTGR